METRNIQFGAHLSDAGDPASEARVAEALGFDLAAIDRDVLNGPPAGLETLTALTWVAARTTSITLVPNVLALPIRHPALVPGWPRHSIGCPPAASCWLSALARR